MAKLKHTIEKYKMLNKGDRVLVALSGGPDSVALLHMLIELKNERAWPRKSMGKHAMPLQVAAAHLDHSIRKGSGKDREFCQALCKSLKIKFYSKKINVPAISTRQKLSIEETGRNARYQYFETLSKKYRYNKIALGHTLDDSVETVLFNMIRGTGLAGLAGIPPMRGKIIRPFIECEKREILDFLKNEKIEYNDDPTNVSNVYSRNKIRNIIIPALLNINPGAKANIARLLEIVPEELEYIRQSSVSAYNLAVLKSGKTKIVLDLELLDRYHRALRKKVLEEAVARLTGGSSNLSFGAFDRALSIVDGKSGGRANLVPGIYIEKSSGRVAIIRETSGPRPVRLKMPGKTVLFPDGAFLEAEIKPKGVLPEFDKTNRSVFIDLEKAADLKVRYWRSGDRIRPLGMTGHRLLSDIFIDKRIPEFERGIIPLVVSGDKIAWIAGVTLSDDFKITPKTKKVISIKLCEPS